jgi:hypothetical protein
VYIFGEPKSENPKQITQVHGSIAPLSRLSYPMTQETKKCPQRPNSLISPDENTDRATYSLAANLKAMGTCLKSHAVVLSGVGQSHHTVNINSRNFLFRSLINYSRFVWNFLTVTGF